MLKRLRIKNFALIDELEVKFGPGLNVLTGVTGAGKSIIVSAIEIAAGNRGSDEIVRTGKDSALVEAEFDIGNAVPSFKNELGDFRPKNNLITFKREYKKAGGGKAYIGRKRVNLSDLKKISTNLISILGQHSHQKLLDPSTHINYLDNFANLNEDLSCLRKLYNEATNLKDRLSYTLRNMLEIKDKIDLLKFQISEIEKANLIENEEESLKSEKKLLENSRVIKESGETAISILLESEDSVIERVGETEKILRASLAGHEKAGDITGMISAASDSINQAVIKIRSFIDGIEDDPERLEEVNSRLYEIFRLKKKYGTDVSGLLDYLEKSKRELNDLRIRSDDPETIRGEFDEKLAGLNKLAQGISGKRRAAKAKLEKSVAENLARMGMQKTRFVIDITRRKDDDGIYKADGENLAGDSIGFDVVEFLFCANPGEGLKPLARIASGGEISRVMLAMKNAFMDKSIGGCEIFDEIDVGISGEAAARVADQLKQLSGNHQVICITHLHQIASAADCHFKVFKKKLRGRFVTMIEELKSEDRVREIASLLSGKSITKKALEGAREILNNSGR
ncbi:MAG: DNA repair protein RecN [Candidatus Zixiibacteriota bacterium]|nr:MAG: DNA repair protein RecN [candidate division Zixibacteria bacterium]